MTRLAIAQIPMHWELADNVAAMKHAMDVARAEGAALCTFAELAVTGFHRRIVEWGKPGLVDPAIDEVRERAASLGLAVAFGAPTFDGTGARFNSHVMVDETGAIAAIVSKRGLTDPEATFFERGASRPVAMLAGLACSAVICREVEDRERVLADLAGRRVDVLLWPGQMRPDPDKPLEDPPGHVARAGARPGRAGPCRAGQLAQCAQSPGGERAHRAQRVHRADGRDPVPAAGAGLRRGRLHARRARVRVVRRGRRRAGDAHRRGRRGVSDVRGPLRILRLDGA